MSFSKDATSIYDLMPKIEVGPGTYESQISQKIKPNKAAFNNSVEKKESTLET